MFLLSRDIKQEGAGIARILDSFEIITLTNPSDNSNLAPIRISAGVNTVETEVDRDGNTIEVTFIEDIQGGVIHATAANKSLAFDLAIHASDPNTIIDRWQNKINSAHWFAGAPGVWLCTRVGVVPIREWENPPLWKFTFEFQAKPLPGWQPWVRYIDPQSGKPPPGLIEGTGYKQVKHYWTADFNILRQG